MLPGYELIQTLLRQSTSTGSRSTALKPLAWLIGITFAALIGSGMVQLPGWVTIALVVYAGFELAAYVAAYFYLMFRNPDFLRSERFSLSKIAIQKSARGDDLTGFVNEQPMLLAPQASKRTQDKG